MHLRNRERCFCQKIPANQTKRPCKQILTFCVSKFLPLQIHSCAFFSSVLSVPSPNDTHYLPNGSFVKCSLFLLCYYHFVILFLPRLYRDLVETLSRSKNDFANIILLLKYTVCLHCDILFLLFSPCCNRYQSLESTVSSRFSKAQLHFFLSVSRKSSIFVVEYGNCIYNHTACERLYPLRSGASSKRISC